MRRLFLVALVISLLAVAAPPQASLCRAELLEKWNRFAADVNAYIKGNVEQGVVDARIRLRLEKEWRSVNRCECW